MLRSLALLILVLASCGACLAQAEDQYPPGDPRNRKDDHPRGIDEAISKMRIDRDKKKFNEMLKRGEDVAKLASQLTETGPADRLGKVTEIGKLVKKIREDLGGDDAEDEKRSNPPNSVEAVKALKEAVNGLSEELKKVDRFTVSASAIESANNILRLVKYIRG